MVVAILDQADSRQFFLQILILVLFFDEIKIGSPDKRSKIIVLPVLDTATTTSILILFFFIEVSIGGAGIS